MKIYFYGTGNPIASFVKRRIAAIAKNDVNCFITSKNKTIKYINDDNIDVKRNIDLKIFEFILMVINILIRPRLLFISILLLYKNRNHFTGGKLKTLIKFIFYLKYKFDIFHFQWIAHLYEISWIKPYLRTPVMASVRGSMVTIYPFKYLNYEDKLREAFRLADRLHFVSRGLMDFCLQRFQLDPAKCFVNYNGIDTEKFKPVEDRFHEKKHEKIRLVSVGALIWRKNFQDLLKIIKQSNYLHVIELQIIGEGEERFILEFMISKYQLENQVKLLGQLSEEQIIEYLQHADIYLSTSYAEGLSNAVMEAAACGLPVIAFDCEGMNEIIQTNVSGFIIEHGRTDLFVQALDQLIENSSLRREMGQAARQHVVNNLDEDSQVEAMIREYQNLIDTFHSSNERAH